MELFCTLIQPTLKERDQLNIADYSARGSTERPHGPK